ncbi:substrate-binding domain-containing protein [Streptomonospora litoralis]|uniref:HTH-type transcriptional repressor CytR n=1 Tax=Streptomonospora litoralis TaxID=2498135 RepID=A0A4P6Q3Y5_9ACTN|nr:HTH-type transcriptional repressor CytR [Streptomonospora litoralis]
MEELAAAGAVVEDSVLAHPLAHGRREVGARGEVGVVVAGNPQRRDTGGAQRVSRGEHVVAGQCDVVAHNDLLAIGILRRLAERGVRVPDELSVAGYDDILGADFCVPALTTLSGPQEEAGRAAVEILLTRGSAAEDGAGPRRVVLPSHLVIRDSTGPAPG